MPDRPPRPRPPAACPAARRVPDRVERWARRERGFYANAKHDTNTTLGVIKWGPCLGATAKTGKG